MNIPDLITLSESRLTSLDLLKTISFKSRDVQQLIDIERQITETYNTLAQLRGIA